MGPALCVTKGRIGNSLGWCVMCYVATIQSPTVVQIDIAQIVVNIEDGKPAHGLPSCQTSDAVQCTSYATVPHSTYLSRGCSSAHHGRRSPTGMSRPQHPAIWPLICPPPTWADRELGKTLAMTSSSAPCTANVLLYAKHVRASRPSYPLDNDLNLNIDIAGAELSPHSCSTLPHPLASAPDDCAPIDLGPAANVPEFGRGKPDQEAHPATARSRRACPTI